ncbi:neuralized-like protein 4 [Hetaerina americana]|uniref:neuralized-like protein 4 n=1 Tax=Hetaerina americana TaxID=62018 RepID=UPI003A7F5F99
MQNLPSAASRMSGNPSLRIDIPPKQMGEDLYFHEKCGKNVVLINSGLTAYRRDPEEEAYYGEVFTHRHLFDNELFEVTIDEKIGKWNSYSFGIGVTVQNPAVELPQWLHDMEDCSWYMYGNDVYHFGDNLIEGYGFDIRNIKEGDRLGVMRKDNGTLHFFLNDVDMGPSVTDVPSGVYGIIDIGGCTVRATIVSSSTPISR